MIQWNMMTDPNNRPSCRYCSRLCKWHKGRWSVHCSSLECKRKFYTDRTRARYHSRKASGACVTEGCQHPRVEKKLQCQSCIDRKKRMALLRTEKKDTRGICIHSGCWEKAKPGFRMCSGHLQKRREHYQTKKESKKLRSRVRSRSAVDMWLGRLPS